MNENKTQVAPGDSWRRRETKNTWGEDDRVARNNPQKRHVKYQNDMCTSKLWGFYNLQLNFQFESYILTDVKYNIENFC